MAWEASYHVLALHPSQPLYEFGEPAFLPDDAQGAQLRDYTAISRSGKHFAMRILASPQCSHERHVFAAVDDVML